MPLLDVKELTTDFIIGAGCVQAVRGVSFSVDEGESVGLVGESGSGKSVTMLSVMRLLPDNARINADSIAFDGVELTALPQRELRKLHGDSISMVFQDPMTSLNPLLTVGFQLMEPLKLHAGMKKREALKRAMELLKLVDMPDAESRMRQYPHELSGGMRQRVMIAMALALTPKLLIADEPTTALDVTIQAQILELLNSLKRKMGMSVIMITHDLGVIAGMCSRVIVMYGGVICEQGTARDIFYEPKHPYTWGLLDSIPKPTAEHVKLKPIPGSPPDMISPPAGCPFAPRCRYAMRVCREYMPPETRINNAHSVSCHLMHPMAQGVRA